MTWITFLQAKMDLQTTFGNDFYQAVGFYSVWVNKSIQTANSISFCTWRTLCVLYCLYLDGLWFIVSLEKEGIVSPACQAASQLTSPDCRVGSGVVLLRRTYAEDIGYRCRLFLLMTVSVWAGTRTYRYFTPVVNVYGASIKKARPVKVPRLRTISSVRAYPGHACY